jgi:ribosomal-protein-alanine N-acetyltransferase
MLSTDPVILETERLRLVQCTVRQLEKLIEGPNAFTAAFSHRVVDDYRGFPEALEFSLAKLTEPSADADWWAPFLFIRREDGATIGIGGFKGPPDSAGVVEFGYRIAPSCRGQGLATEAAAALIQHLFGTGRVTVARAHTLPEPSASTRVLEKCGFRHVEDVVDPEDGPVWRWERSK